MAELNIASSEVFPAPTPTAGTLPTCFEFVGAAAAAWADELLTLVVRVVDKVVLSVEELTGAAATVLDVLAVAETSADEAGKVELKSAKSDVFPAPTPTAGTFPSSLAFVSAADGVASGGVGEAPVAPVDLACSKWKDIGSESAMKRLEGALALRTTSKFLLLCQHDQFDLLDLPCRYLFIGPANAN
jgi:hypothetical protein